MQCCRDSLPPLQDAQQQHLETIGEAPRCLQRVAAICPVFLLLVRSYGKKGLLQMQAPVARLAQREPR